MVGNLEPQQTSNYLNRSKPQQTSIMNVELQHILLPYPGRGSEEGSKQGSGFRLLQFIQSTKGIHKPEHNKYFDNSKQEFASSLTKIRDNQDF